MLRWPGGKRWIAPAITARVERVLEGTYYEPFLGGAAVFLGLQNAKAVLSDINEELIHCYLTVREHPLDVLHRIWSLSNNAECYYRVRSMRPRSDIGRAARFIYLNRTCWGGLYRVNAQGAFNVPFGNNGRVICRGEDLMRVADALAGAELKAADFEEVVEHAGEGDVVYCDPPYSVVTGGGFRRYNGSVFSWEDQQRLASACKNASKRGAIVLVSGPTGEDVSSLYTGWHCVDFTRWSRVSGKVEGRRKILECLMVSDSIWDIRVGTGVAPKIV